MTTEMTLPTTEALHQDTYRGIPYAILMGPYTINGYMQMEEGHPWVDIKDDWDIPTTVSVAYRHFDPMKRRIASVLLESFLFYSGFYLPLHYASKGKLTNTADIIRLIIRDEAVHGYYIGYKYQKSLERLSKSERNSLKDDTIDLLLDLYFNEVRYTEEMYDELGWTEDVKRFLRYNANKALNNLGYEGVFPVEDTRVSPAILAQLAPDANENFDFFSGSGSSYVIGKAEHTDDDDWVWD